jgi:hypothetical protein
MVKSRDSSVGTEESYWLDDWGSRVRFAAGAGNLSLHHRVKTGSEAHPASYSMDTRGSFPEVKRPGCEADHSPPSSAEVKECMELYLHSPNTSSWCSVKAQGQLYLYLSLSLTSPSKWYILTGVFIMTVGQPIAGSITSVRLPMDGVTRRLQAQSVTQPVVTLPTCDRTDNRARVAQSLQTLD